VHIDKTLAEGNMCDECGRAQTSVVVVIEDYSQCKSYINKKVRKCDANSVGP
jgi:hypothetical protein